MSFSDPLVVIGAGPAGLAVSSQYSGEKRLLEKESECGGLCRSFEIDGGVFDLGGHAFHTPHVEIDRFMRDLMGSNWSIQPRNAQVYFNGQLIPYPFQNNFDKLADRNIVEQCLPAARSNDGNPANLAEWIVGRFGPGISAHFMLPYNRKLWARDLRRMTHEWTEERVVVAGVGDSTTTLGKRRPLQSSSWVGYPARGGFSQICDALAERCGPIEYNCEAVRIDPDAGELECADGRAWEWGRLVSTMPAPLLLKSIPSTPPALLQRAERLEAVALRLMMMLVADSLPDAPQRVYIADAAIPPHKVAFNHMSSPSLRKKPVHAVICEISHSAEKPLPSNRELEDSTIDWLIDAGFVSFRGDFARIVHVDVDFAYPVYTHERAAVIEEILAYLEPLDIHTIGRFGRWEYINSDECIRQGLALGRRLSAARCS